MRKIFKFFKTIIVTLIVIVFLALIGIAVFAYFFDLNKYKDNISQIVEKQIGREFLIKGDARLGISLIPTLELNDVELSNASWAKNPKMITLDRLDVQISILPLLKKEIEIYKAILIKPNIYLEVNASGKANWDFEGLKSAMAGNKTYAQSRGNMVTDASVDNSSGEVKLPIEGLFAKNILIENGSVELTNEQTGKDIKLKINNFNVTSKSIYDDMNLKFDVVFNNDAIIGSGKVGSIKTLMQSYNPYPVELKVKAFNVSAKVDGSIINPLGSDIRYILNLDVVNPRGNFGAPATNFVGSADGNLKNVKVDISKLDVEGSIITGTVKANIASKVPSVNADLKSDLVDVTKIVPKSEEAVSFIPSIVSTAHASKMVPETLIPYEFLNMVNAEVVANIKSLILTKDITVDGLSLNAKLKDGNMDVKPLIMKFGDGNLNVDMKVVSKDREIFVNAIGKDIVIQELYDGLKPTNDDHFAITEGGKTDIDVNVKATGNTAREIVQNLDGQMVAIVKESKVNSGQLKFVSSGIIDQITKILQIDKKARVKSTLNCAVLRADFANGKARFPKGIAFDKDDFKLSSDGSINLINDKIDFNIKPFSGKVTDVNITKAIASFLKVSGTLQNPTVKIDETQAAKAALGMVVNAPIYAASSVVLDASSAPCYDALEGTVYSTVFPKPTGVAATGQGAYKSVEGAVRDTVSGVNNIIKDAGTSLKDKLKSGNTDTKNDIEDVKADIKKEVDAAKDLFKAFRKK